MTKPLLRRWWNLCSGDDKTCAREIAIPFLIRWQNLCLGDAVLGRCCAREMTKPVLGRWQNLCSGDDETFAREMLCSGDAESCAQAGWKLFSTRSGCWAWTFWSEGTEHMILLHMSDFDLQMSGSTAIQPELVVKPLPPWRGETSSDRGLNSYGNYQVLKKQNGNGWRWSLLCRTGTSTTCLMNDGCFRKIESWFVTGRTWNTGLRKIKLEKLLIAACDRQQWPAMKIPY